MQACTTVSISARPLTHTPFRARPHCSSPTRMHTRLHEHTHTHAPHWRSHAPLCHPTLPPRTCGRNREKTVPRANGRGRREEGRGGDNAHRTKQHEQSQGARSLLPAHPRPGRSRVADSRHSPPHTHKGPCSRTAHFERRGALRCLCQPGRAEIDADGVTVPDFLAHPQELAAV